MEPSFSSRIKWNGTRSSWRSFSQVTTGSGTGPDGRAARPRTWGSYHNKGAGGETGDRNRRGDGGWPVGGRCGARGGRRKQQPTAKSPRPCRHLPSGPKRGTGDRPCLGPDSSRAARGGRIHGVDLGRRREFDGPDSRGGPQERLERVHPSRTGEGERQEPSADPPAATPGPRRRRVG